MPLPKTPAERQRYYRERQAEKLATAQAALKQADRAARMEAALNDIVTLLKDSIKPLAVQVRERAEEGLNPTFPTTDERQDR